MAEVVFRLDERVPVCDVTEVLLEDGESGCVMTGHVPKCNLSL